MAHDPSSPDAHAQVWRLISDQAHSARTWIDAHDANPALLLVLDTQGDWWAVAPDCRECAGSLTDVLRKGAVADGLDELRCAHCGAAHGPGVDECAAVTLMVVDEEIYAAPDITAAAGQK